MLTNVIISHCSVTATLRQSLVHDFGSALMARDSLWLIGSDYLANCGPTGLGALELQLTRVHVANERQAHKVLAVAKAHGFAEAERELCRVQATRSLQRERLGNALEWAIRSGDNVFVTAVADRFLDVSSRVTSVDLCAICLNFTKLI